MDKSNWFADFYHGYIRPLFCKLLPHTYAYEPMVGDEPPFEYEYCARCGEPNPRFVFQSGVEPHE